MSPSLSQAMLASLLLCIPALAQGPQTQQIRSVHGSFDPLADPPAIARELQADASTNLWIVQFHGRPTQEGRDAVSATGAEIHGYVPDNSYVVRMEAATSTRVGNLETVRWVGAYHPAFRLEPELRTALANGTELAPARYNIVVVDKHRDKPALIQAITALGGRIEHEQPGSILLEATLTSDQLAATANLDQVLWIDRWTPTGLDMNNARIQGGGNYVESQAGYTGSGVNAHIYEGLEAGHVDFTGTPTNVRSGGFAASHGHCTAGIVFGNGTSHSGARGMAPDCGKFYTHYSSVTTSRWQVVSDLVNVHDVSHTTASWGNSRTRSYTSISADADDIIFDHDIAWTQSQSNAGNPDSRPQAWAKNIFSIGGVDHFNNSSAGDDSWLAGNASTGPAADGRIKPTMCAYYDSILTSDRSGNSGYSSRDYFTSFGGTSGATPIVAGHNVLAIEMFTDGVFGNPLRNPGGSRHSNRPHFPTLKALQVASAAQYSFTSSSNDNRREHQGWGFPDLQRMWDYRNKTFIVDETDVVRQNDVSTWNINVQSGEPDLRICMSYADPAASPFANPTRINDLSLRVTSPGGTTYWGNNGLWQGVWSVAGGSEDNINTVESVFVQNPQAGIWKVEVLATLVAQDSHVETTAVDADYGLVVSGGTGTNRVQGAFRTFGSGCPGSVALPQYCAQLNPNGGTLTNQSTSNEYAYVVNNSGTVQVTDFDVYTRSLTGGNVIVPAYLYSDSGGQPGSSPVAVSAMIVGPNAGFYNASFPSPVTLTGTFYVAVNHSAGTTALSNLTSGSSGSAFWRNPPLTGSWGTSSVITAPSFRVSCQGGGGNAIPQIGHTGVPKINSSFQVEVSQAKPNALGLVILGFYNTQYSGGSLPAPLPNAPGCDLLVSLEQWDMAFTDSNGDAAKTYNVPNDNNLVGLSFYHQWLINDPTVNTLGYVASDGGESVIGN